MANGVTL